MARAGECRAGNVGRFYTVFGTRVNENGTWRPGHVQDPRGEEAGRLWDGTLLVSGVAGFHELKGRPHAEPDFS